MWEIILGFHSYTNIFISAMGSNITELWAHTNKHRVYMYHSLCAEVTLCVLTCQACSLVSIGTFISVFLPKWDKIWACARKNFEYMHTSMYAWLLTHAKVSWCWLTRPPISIDTHISLILSSWAKIWAIAYKKIVCMHISMSACTYRNLIVMTIMSPWFYRYLCISNLT